MALNVNQTLRLSDLRTKKESWSFWIFFQTGRSNNFLSLWANNIKSYVYDLQICVIVIRAYMTSEACVTEAALCRAKLLLQLFIVDRQHSLGDGEAEGARLTMFTPLLLQLIMKEDLAAWNQRHHVTHGCSTHLEQAFVVLCPHPHCRSSSPCYWPSWPHWWVSHSCSIHTSLRCYWSSWTPEHRRGCTQSSSLPVHTGRNIQIALNFKPTQFKNRYPLCNGWQWVGCEWSADTERTLVCWANRRGWFPLGCSFLERLQPRSGPCGSPFTKKKM